MNESEENKELIRRMAETLRNHAEPYKEGAWERFAALNGVLHKRVLWWPYAATAAVLLLAVGLFWFNQPNGIDVAGPEVVEMDMERAHPVPQESAQPTTINELPDAAREPIKLVSKSPRPRRQDRIAVPKNVPDPETVDVSDVTRSVPEESSQRLAIVPEREASEEEIRQFPIESDHGLSGQQTVNQEFAGAANTRSDNSVKKWNIGVVVAPSLTSEKVNWGGGVAVAYQLSDRFSLGSGVSIGRLGLGENPNYDPMSSYDPSRPSAYPTDGAFHGLTKDRQEYKEDVYITSNVVTLDVPLDVRYEVAKGFYTSVGVSYVAVLNEQRTEHFIDGLNKPPFESSSANRKDLTASTHVGYTSEKMAVQPLVGKGYAGFMNFSIGRKMPLSGKLSLSIEPYFKLPIGRLSKEEMNFTNGGIRIVTGF